MNSDNYKGGFRELEAWREARILRQQIIEDCKLFPKDERFLLIAQIKDSSRSVTANIAEGYGRFTYTDTRNFFIIARGSVTETMEHLSTVCDENYMLEEELKKGEEKCELVFKLINGYINYLDKSRDQIKKRNEPHS